MTAATTPSQANPVHVAKTTKKRRVIRFLAAVGRAVFLTTVGKVVAVSTISLAATVAGIAYTAVHADELVMVTNFGKVIDGPLPPGIYFYWPYFNQIRRYPATLQFLLITDKNVIAGKAEVAALFQESIEVQSKDRVPVSIVLETSYHLVKDQHTVHAFVREFGRSSTEYGTAKIEKLIADICRNATREVVANNSLQDLEASPTKISEAIMSAASNSFRDASGQGALAQLGISIHSLGYRMKINPAIQQARMAEATKQQTEVMRKETIAKKADADALELDSKSKLAAARLAEAKANREAFDASEENSPHKLLLSLLQKWDGRLPNAVILGNDAGGLAPELIAEALRRLDPRSTVSVVPAHGSPAASQPRD
ncbi:MAG TPA: SPFH domain-containing protein [Phycisphaerales bacterium]|nr:SPFH domain-containing protein [Phycisphaerales bacterium]